MKKTDYMEWIAINNYHVAITKHIVKKNASKIKGVETDKYFSMTGFSSFIGQSCLDMVTNNFNDNIFDDLCNEVYIALHDLIQKGLFSVQNNEPKYEMYEIVNKKGEVVKRSSYFDLYRTIENFLYSEKKNFTMIATTSNNKLYEELDGKKVSVAKNNESTNINNNKRIKYYSSIIRFENAINEDKDGNVQSLIDTLETQTNSIDNVMNRFEIELFFTLIKKHYPKYHDDMKTIFNCLLLGFTYEEIELNHNISVSRIKYLMPILRQKYNEYCLTVNITKSINDDIYCDTTRNKSNTYYINRDKRIKPITRIIKVTDIYQSPIKSRPLECGIIDKEEFENIREENYIKRNGNGNDIKYKNVYGSKSKTLIILENGKMYAKLNCSKKALETFKKKLSHVAL